MDISILFHDLLSLLTLTFLEIVLGVDNLIFLSIMTNRLPAEKRKRARRFGLLLALGTRLLLLASVVWLSKLTKPLLTFADMTFSGRDIFLITGGLFLLYKSTQEMHAEFNQFEDEFSQAAPRYANFGMVIVQIAILDIVFSLDSVITAVGLTQNYTIMAIAISIAIITMMFLSEPLSNFVFNYPTIKMLALSFLLLVGVMLIADGFAMHIPRGYLYFAISFSIGVETLNILLSRKKRRRSLESKLKG